MIVSVIVPVHNIPNNLLIDCVNSLLNQSYDKLEILIINDASPRFENYEYLRVLSANSDRVRYFELNDNVGVSAARNLGLDYASGDWVCFVDADDFLLPDAIEKMLQQAKKTEVDIVIGSTRTKHNEEGSVFSESLCTEEVSIIHDEEDSYMKAISDFGLAIWGKLYKRSVWLDVRFPPGVSHFEDVVVLWHFISSRNSYASMPEVCYVSNFRQESATHSNINREKHLRIIQSLRYAISEMGRLFFNYPKILRQLSCFVIRESFANREMFSRLSSDDAQAVKIENIELLKLIKKVGGVSSLLTWSIHLQNRLLGFTVMGYSLPLFYAIRLLYRIEVSRI